MKERREFWLEPLDYDDVLVHDEFQPYKAPEQVIHVREVLPGEISITRETLHAIWDKHFTETKWPKNAKRLIWCELLEQELFGACTPEGPNGGEK